MALKTGGARNLHARVIEEIGESIVSGVLRPGESLPGESQLAEQMSVSRTVLREALKVLAAEGLIEISPNRGASVWKMSEAELRETFELMSGLEAFSGELACERITPAEIADIKALHYAMLACRAQNDLAGYYSRNQAIHDKINEAARNSQLRQTYVAVNRRLQALRFRSNFQIPKWDRAIHDHDEMLKALDDRDGRRLATILRQHLLDKRDAVLQIQSNEDAAGASLKA